MLGLARTRKSPRPRGSPGWLNRLHFVQLRRFQLLDVCPSGHGGLTIYVRVEAHEAEAVQAQTLDFYLLNEVLVAQKVPDSHRT